MRKARLTAFDLGRRRIGKIGQMAFAGMDHQHAHVARGLEHVRDRLHGARQLRHVIAQRFAEAAGLHEVALHVDDQKCGREVRSTSTGPGLAAIVAGNAELAMSCLLKHNACFFQARPVPSARRDSSTVVICLLPRPVHWKTKIKVSAAAGCGNHLVERLFDKAHMMQHRRVRRRRIAAHDRRHHSGVLAVRARKPSRRAKLRGTERTEPSPQSDRHVGNWLIMRSRIDHLVKIDIGLCVAFRAPRSQARPCRRATH